jgi:hypothetical protein
MDDRPVLPPAARRGGAVMAAPSLLRIGLLLLGIIAFVPLSLFFGLYGALFALVFIILAAVAK